MRKILCLLALFLTLPSSAAGAGMTVSAAASLTNAFAELKSIFEKQNPGLAVNTNFAA